MNRNNFIILILASCLLGACQTNPKEGKEGKSVEKISAQMIPYKVAKGYFQNNRTRQLPASPITIEKEFNKLFGKAAIMGENGMPTVIDFSKEYVIAVSKPETNYSTTLNPISLKRDEKGNIVFTYNVSKGEKQSYSIIPCLLIIVAKSQRGELLLNEVN